MNYCLRVEVSNGRLLLNTFRLENIRILNLIGSLSLRIARIGRVNVRSASVSRTDHDRMRNG